MLKFHNGGFLRLLTSTHTQLQTHTSLQQDDAPSQDRHHASPTCLHSVISYVCQKISDSPAHLPGLALPCRQEPIVGFMGQNHDYPAGQQGYGGYMGMQQQQPPAQQQYRQQPSGARLKVMRCVQLKAPESKRALLDFGLGVGVDLDRQVRLRKMLLGGLQNWSCFVCAGSALLHPLRFLTCSPQSKAMTVLRRAHTVAAAQGSCTPTTVKGGG